MTTLASRGWYGLLACLVAQALAPAQILVGPNVQVSRAHPSDAHFEVYAAADPTNPSRMLAASFLYPRDASEGQTIVYASTDGGKDWKPVLEGKSLENTSDPALAYGADGTAYYVVALVPPTGPRSMLLYRSRDGQSWGRPETFSYMDREYAAIDNTGGKYAGRVYVNGNNRIPLGVSDFVLFYSTDQGHHFTGPVKRAGFGKFDATEMGNAVVASDGTLIGVFVQADAPSGRTLCAISSTDGGESFTDAAPISSFVAGGNRKGAHNNVNSLPALAIDPSNGPFRDRLYVVWPDRRSGHSQVYFSFSSDKGKTWSPARVINDNPADDLTDQSMPEVAVNRDGAVGVIWSDRRRHPDNLGWDIRFTASTDGGQTFEPSVQVSETGTNFGDQTFWGPLRPAVSRAVAKPGDSKGLGVQLAMSNFLFIGGDTWGLVADAAGAFHAMWSDNRTGAAQLWTAAIQVGGGKAGVTIPQSRSAAVRPTNPPEDRTPIAKPAAISEEMADLSKSLTIELTRPVLDRASGILSADVRVLNTSATKVRGPFAVRVTSLGSQLADIAVESSLGPNPAWRFEDAELEAGAGTAMKQVRFHLTNFRSFADGDRYRLGILDLHVVVLAGGR